MRQRSKNRIYDRQVEEFEKRDLGPDLEKSGTGVVIRPRSRQMQTSILLDPAIIEKLKAFLWRHRLPDHAKDYRP